MCIIETFGPSFFSPSVAWCLRRMARFCHIKVMRLEVGTFSNVLPCGVWGAATSRSRDGARGASPSSLGSSLLSMPGTMLLHLVQGCGWAESCALLFCSPTLLSSGDGRLGCATSATGLAKASTLTIKPWGWRGWKAMGSRWEHSLLPGLPSPGLGGFTGGFTSAMGWERAGVEAGAEAKGHRIAWGRPCS